MINIEELTGEEAKILLAELQTMNEADVEKLNKEYLVERSNKSYSTHDTYSIQATLRYFNDTLLALQSNTEHLVQLIERLRTLLVKQRIIL